MSVSLLEAVAAGQASPAVPAGLPPEVGQVLEALVSALEGEPQA